MTTETTTKQDVLEALSNAYNAYLEAFVKLDEERDFIANDEFNAFRFHFQALDRIVRLKD